MPPPTLQPQLSDCTDPHSAGTAEISASAAPPQPQQNLEGYVRTEYLDLSLGSSHQGALIEEQALALSYNGLSHAVMMVTPVALEEFVIGFSYAEGIIERVDEIRDLSIKPGGRDGLVAEIELSPRRLSQLQQRRHALRGSSGCGLCGVDSLQAALPELPTLRPCPAPSAATIAAAREQLFAQQSLGRRAGAIHAAMLLSPAGEVLATREDIGRHNALDKLIGAALQQGLSLYGHSIVMSSRCSSELIQKALRAGVSTLINLASPSQLAVEQARRHGLNLIHLPRRNGPRLYAGLPPTAPEPLQPAHE